MPLLDADDPLPHVPCRVLVAGTAGAGKTTLAARIGTELDLRHVEIDALFHGPGWVPRESFETDVDRFSSEPTWVTEWQYHQVRPLLLARADLLVWLDLPRHRVMSQLVRRTVMRRWQRRVLWNGNVEPPLWTVLRDEEHILRWGWKTHHASAERVRAALDDRPDLPVVRLRSHRESAQWVAGPLRSVVPPS